MVGRRQFQKQCLYLGQPESIVGVLSLPTALWRQSGVPGAAVPFPLLRAGLVRGGDEALVTIGRCSFLEKDCGLTFFLLLGYKRELRDEPFRSELLCML